MKVLILDFETTGTDVEKDRPWEMGTLMVDTAWNPGHRAVTRLWAPDYPDISEGARRACKIEQLRLDGETHPKHGIEALIDNWIAKADYVMAYNVQFDRAILEAEAKRHGLVLPEINWVCALNDVPYGAHYRCRQLSHLALDHGIVVDPKTTHGALGDVCLLRDLLDIGGYNFDRILAFRDDPWIYLEAHIGKGWEKVNPKKDAAKADGYSWQTARVTDAPVFEKKWVKRIKSLDFEFEKAKKLPFERSRINVNEEN